MIILIASFSCTERIQLELDSSYTRLVVYGEITDMPGVHQVRLTTTSDYFYNKEIPFVSDAIVEISDGEVNHLLTEKGNGIYETSEDFTGVPGKTYQLNISDVDINQDGEKEFYRASSYMPELGKMDSISLKYTTNSFFSGWEIQVWAWDRPEKRDYYVFKAYLNGRLVTDTLTELVVQNDDLFNGNYTYGITSQFLIDSNADERALPGDTVVFEINGINQEYYNFLVEAQNESFGNNPLFSGPPANITTNLSNDAIGFFTAYSVKQARKIVPRFQD